MISIILPSFKRPHLLRLGLSSIARYKPLGDFEVIVLNDYLEDDTKKVCDSFKEELNVNYIFTGQRNVGGTIKSRVPGFAINIGIKKAKGEMIILSCPEVYHLNNALELIEKELVKNSKAMVIPDFIHFDLKQILTDQLVNLNDEELKTVVINKDLITAEKSAWGGHVIMPYLMGIHKYELVVIGGYDEDMLGKCADDNDLVGRLQTNGLVHVKTRARAIHLYHSGTGDGRAHWGDKDWEYNYNIFISRRRVVKRNVGREWGILDA